MDAGSGIAEKAGQSDGTIESHRERVETRQKFKSRVLSARETARIFRNPIGREGIDRSARERFWRSKAI